MSELFFYYDVVCPWAFLASQRVEALAARTGATLRWCPVLLGGLYQHHRAPQDPGAVMPPARARMELADRERNARWHGVALSPHPDHPVRTVDAMRLLVACDPAVRPTLTHALFRAYHVEHRDLSDRTVLAAIASAHGVPASTIEAGREPLFAATREAAERGCFGVPVYRVGERWWWGGDRERFAAEALTGVPDRTPALEGDAAGRVVEVFHDFSSPFSYLGVTQIERVAQEVGATVHWRPFLLGAVFKAIGTPIVPLASFNAAKSAYYLRDLEQWARHWGVPFAYNPHFPLRTVTALRLALQAPELTHALYRATWADQRDVGDTAVLEAIVREAGRDPAPLLAGTQDPAIKDQLRTNTEEAVALGACGAPTFRVGDQLYWGQDRLHFVQAALIGSLR